MDKGAHVLVPAHVIGSERGQAASEWKFLPPAPVFVDSGPCEVHSARSVSDPPSDVGPLCSFSVAARHKHTHFPQLGVLSTPRDTTTSGESSPRCGSGPCAAPRCRALGAGRAPARRVGDHKHRERGGALLPWYRPPKALEEDGSASPRRDIARVTPKLALRRKRR